MHPLSRCECSAMYVLTEAYDVAVQPLPTYPAPSQPRFVLAPLIAPVSHPPCQVIGTSRTRPVPVVPASSLIYTGTRHGFLPTRPMGMFLADPPETHTHGCGYGFLWVRVRVCSKKPMGYPCTSLNVGSDGGVNIHVVSSLGCGEALSSSSA